MIAYRWFKLLVMVLVWLCIGACANVGNSTTSTTKGRGSVVEAGRPRVLIIYQSKYGSTRQYAQWIHRDIPSDIFDVEKGAAVEFSKYEAIVFGSSVRMGRIVIAPFIVENWSNIKEKKVVVFTTSGIPPGHPNIRKIFNNNLPEEIRKEIKYFPLRGRILSKDLSFFDKFLVAVGRMMEKDERLRNLMIDDFDEVKPENLIPLLENIKTLLLQRDVRAQATILMQSTFS
jgi:menaquinone-dependent protoporphyrinogen IX oxidase